jgi:hypothetical protein
VVYRITVRSNPRILAILVVLPILIAGAIAAAVLVNPVVGLILLAVLLFVGWQMGKLLRRQLATRVETLTDEMLFLLHGEEKVLFPWEKIRLCGIALDEGQSAKKRRLFVYNEEADKMFTLTDEFENLDGLAAELRDRGDFREILLAPGETLKDKLRELIGQG